MRSTATAIILIGVIALGTGMGPMIVGLVSDSIAASSLADSLGAYGVVCPGGKPLPGASAEMGIACAQASAAGMRAGLLTACLAYAAAAPCFIMSARTIREPLQTIAAG